jgi:HK97 family phage major capsid protein
MAARSSWSTTATSKRVGKAVVFFSRSALGQTQETDVRGGVKRKVSTRYIPWKMKRVEAGNPEKGTLDKYRVVDWEVLENSLVAIPLDHKGTSVDPTGRSQTEDMRMFTVEIDDGEPVEEERTDMDKKNGTDPEAGGGGGGTTAAVVQDFSARNAEIAEILGMCRRDGVSAEETEEFVRAGKAPGEVARALFAKKSTSGSAQPAGEAIVELTRRQVEDYSYARAVEGGLKLNGHEKGKFDGFELEMHQELLRKVPDGFDYHGGVLVPMRLEGKRAMDTKTAGKGSELVPQQAGELIEHLRDESLLTRLGAKTLVGLNAKVPFPKQKSGMQFFWVADNPPADVTDSDISLGISWLDPKALAGMNIFSRQLLSMSLLDMDDLIRKEIAVGIALALDLAGIHGKGGEGVPLGLYKNPDVNVKAMGGVPDYAKMIDLFAQVRTKNAHRGTLGLGTTPQMAGKLMATPEFTNAARGIWTGTFDDGFVAGYKAVSSTQISSTMTGQEEVGGTEQGIIAGNFSDILIGTYSIVEITADPYTLLGKAMVRMHGYFMADTLLRHGESITIATGATLS